MTNDYLKLHEGIGNDSRIAELEDEIAALKAQVEKLEQIRQQQITRGGCQAALILRYEGALDEIISKDYSKDQTLANIARRAREGE